MEIQKSVLENWDGIYKNRNFWKILNLKNTVTGIKHFMNEFKSRIATRNDQWSRGQYRTKYPGKYTKTKKANGLSFI